MNPICPQCGSQSQLNESDPAGKVYECCLCGHLWEPDYTDTLTLSRERINLEKGPPMPDVYHLSEREIVEIIIGHMQRKGYARPGAHCSLTWKFTPVPGTVKTHTVEATIEVTDKEPEPPQRAA